MTEQTTTTPPTTSTPTGGSTATGSTAARAPRTTATTDTGPIVVPAAAAPEPLAPATTPAPAVDGTRVMDVPGAAEGTAPDATAQHGNGPSATGPHATGPVTVRPRVRGTRRGPLTRMGPWAPVAGGVLGLLAGLVSVLLLAPAADGFHDRLALVLLVVGLGMLGTAGTLLADEVRMLRQGPREAAVRPAWVEATVPLLSGLTPARLLLVLSVVVLFLAAFVTR